MSTKQIKDQFQKKVDDCFAEISRFSTPQPKQVILKIIQKQLKQKSSSSQATSDANSMTLITQDKHFRHEIAEKEIPSQNNPLGLCRRLYRNVKPKVNNNVLLRAKSSNAANLDLINEEAEDDFSNKLDNLDNFAKTKRIWTKQISEQKAKEALIESNMKAAAKLKKQNQNNQRNNNIMPNNDDYISGFIPNQNQIRRRILLTRPKAGIPQDNIKLQDNQISKQDQLRDSIQHQQANSVLLDSIMDESYKEHIELSSDNKRFDQRRKKVKQDEQFSDQRFKMIKHFKDQPPAYKQALLAMQLEFGKQEQQQTNQIIQNYDNNRCQATYLQKIKRIEDFVRNQNSRLIKDRTQVIKKEISNLNKLGIDIQNKIHQNIKSVIHFDKQNSVDFQQNDLLSYAIY